MYDVIRLLAAGAAGLLLFCGPAQAEVLRVDGVYPAESDAAAAMNAIAVESFGGPDGPELAIRTEDTLRAVAINGESWFRILTGGFSREADGVLRGTATAEIRRDRYTEKKERCVAKDDKGKCTERRKEEIRCVRRTIEFVPNVRLVSREGVLIHADGQAETITQSRCEDDSSDFRSPEAVVREMADKVAARLRFALAPVQRSESIRVLEDRKGLSRDDGERFRNALRLTKTDVGAACRQWQAIADSNPSHSATAFNVGLCDEAAGDLDGAEKLYRRAVQLTGSSSVADGLRRIEARRRADRQFEAHSRR